MNLPRAAALRSSLGLLCRVPAFVANPLGDDAAREIVQQRLAGRSESFLSLVRDGAYAPANGPNYALLRHAGIEFGDLESMVRADGVEGALQTLYRAGVYFSVAEYKGRTPIRRGSFTLETSELAFRNPLARFHIPARSGGSRGRGTPILIDLDFIRACGASNAVSLAARGGSEWEKFVWEVPGAGARFRLLKLASFGKPPVAWFSQLAVDDAALHPVFRWSERALRLAARLGGVSLPRPVHSAVEHPIEVARFMRGLLDGDQIPHALCFTSSAVRLSEAAQAEGISLAGAQLTVGGEPVTEARLKRIRECGLNPWPRYGSMETGPMGYPCLSPNAADDVHLQSDLHALIQPMSPGSGLPRDAFLVSSLHPRAPFVFVNASMGDCGHLERRACGCPMADMGFGFHLHGIRSFEKLTAAGMTFLDVDVIRILEQVLPAAFGGGPTDYQLEETLDEVNGESRMTLRAHPRLGPVDEAALQRTVLKELAKGSIVDAAMSEVWSRLSLLGVERKAPAITPAAKILHLRTRTSKKS